MWLAFVAAVTVDCRRHRIRFDCSQTMRHLLTQLLYLHSNHCVMKCKQISFVGYVWIWRDAGTNTNIDHDSGCGR